ncbi:MAG: PH domain-containing protein [Theionarchaea archaeon]|nr:PH domain-containing protein [Theionarchaea archaeon]MBU7036928.1 PH domain-containing protein [Theionarchaea archaeon]
MNEEQKGSVTGGIFTGLEIEVPRDIKDVLIPGEHVLHAVRQARLEQALTPDSIFVTTHRIVVRRPTTLGLRRNITDYRYSDMANTRIEKGIINSSIHIEMRFMSEDCVLRGIPNKSASQIFRTIEEQITRTRAGLPLVEKPAVDDPFRILKVRLARGEISKEEYQSLKKELEEL